jgi:hypothetical protein
MSVFANTSGGVIVGGIFGARQNPQQTEFADNAPEVLAFKATWPSNPTAVEGFAKTAAKDFFGTIRAPIAKGLRAAGAVQVDEINLLRQWITSFKAAVAAATSLADLKTRVAALANMPDRTLSQYKTAVLNHIDGGA